MKQVVLWVLVSAFIVSGLTSCISTKKIVVKPNEAGRYDFSKIESDPEYEKLNERLKIGGPFTFYYYVKDDWSTFSERYYVTKIEGLMPIEEYNALIAEHAAIEAQKKAEQAAAEEARRLALEEANRYDPSKFTVVPSDFKPANYTIVDLFKAASDSEKLQRFSNRQEAARASGLEAMFGITSGSILRYVSDLTFLSQSGTDLIFSSDDRAITQNMKIDQRSGLQAGQKVRVYYNVMRAPLITWEVVAIERR